MWSATTQKLNPQVTKTTLNANARPLSFSETIDLWCANQEFRTWFTALLSASPFDAFFWETPPITNATLHSPFEFVTVEGPSLSRLAPDPSPFAANFETQESKDMLTFPNLGGDAILVVPAPIADHSCYTHLARFLRNAPRAQTDALWASVGHAAKSLISSRPTWLSTAGLGVSWLHLRLDTRPKYYRFEPYTKPPYSN
jgi:hypothetical protein